MPPGEPTATTPSATDRNLVLVAGSGRSGTSLFGGILQRLGYHVPQPEVRADVTNPRGFAESQWVVDFHSRLLAASQVQVSDARPNAWALTAREGAFEHNSEELRTWLAGHFAKHPRLIIKDPRLSWFLPLWRRCASDLGVEPRFVTMLRHPAAVIDSKQRYYGSWQGDVGRAAAWINQMLYTERATRESPRIFVRYGDLLDDWTIVLSRVGEILDLSIVQTAPAARLREVHQYVDPSLSRSKDRWGEGRMPGPLRDLAENVWQMLSSLADKDGEPPAADLEALDAARESYIELYQDAEAIAQSSVVAVQRATQATAKKQAAPSSAAARRPAPRRWLIPKRVRRLVPLATRKRLLAAARRAKQQTKPAPAKKPGPRPAPPPTKAA